MFQRRACGKLPGSHLAPDLEDELLWAKKFMVRDCPRTLSVDMSRFRIVLFTDASLESDDSVGRIGLVCFLVHDGHIVDKYFFADPVPIDVMNLWQQRTVKIISTLELWAAVAGVILMGQLHPGLRMFAFVDNEAARASMIACSSSVVIHKL